MYNRQPRPDHYQGAEFEGPVDHVVKEAQVRDQPIAFGLGFFLIGGGEEGVFEYGQGAAQRVYPGGRPKDYKSQVGDYAPKHKSFEAKVEGGLVSPNLTDKHQSGEGNKK